MKHLFSLPALILFTLTIAYQDAVAQWDWGGAVELGLYQNQNIFRSPDRMRLDGQLIGIDSLYQNDLSTPLELDLDISYSTARYTARLDYASTLNRYGKFDNLNGGWHTLAFENTWNVTEALQFYAEIEGRKSKRVGTDVLGDQLARLFEYVSIGPLASLEWQLTRSHALEMAYEWDYRDYTETDGSASLDSYSHYLTVHWTYRTPVRQGRYWQTEVEAVYRAKNYLSYRARDASGQQSDAHPLNYLDYYDLDVGIEQAWSRSWTWQFEVGGRYRHDPFQDYYTYGSGHLDMGLEWRPTRSIEVDLDAGWRRIIHAVKDAPQADTDDYPDLIYDYLDWGISIDYEVLNAVSLVAFLESDNRYSNVTLESYRVRRSYDSLQGGIALRVDLDQMVMTSD